MWRLVFCCLGLMVLTAVGCAGRASLQSRPPEPVALWLEGAGTLDKKSAKAGETIMSGTRIEAGLDHPVAIDLSEEYDCELLLGAGAVATLHVGSGSRPEERQLTVQLDRGCIEMRLNDAAYYEDIRLVSGVLEVRATNARFLAERIERDADYVAVIRGNVVANLRPTLANALHQPEGIQLQSRQGLAANASSGFSAIDQLNHRPRLPASAAQPIVGLQEQCMTASVEENSADDWSTPAVAPAEPPVNVETAAPEPENELAGPSQPEPANSSP